MAFQRIPPEPTPGDLALRDDLMRRLARGTMRVNYDAIISTQFDKGMGGTVQTQLLDDEEMVLYVIESTSIAGMQFDRLLVNGFPIGGANFASPILELVADIQREMVGGPPTPLSHWVTKPHQRASPRREVNDGQGT